MKLIHCSKSPKYRQALWSHDAVKTNDKQEYAQKKLNMPKQEYAQASKYAQARICSSK